MGSIGPAELLVVLVVALIVLGPNRLPEAARSIGKAVSELRRVTSGMQAEVRDAFSEAAPSYPKPAPAPVAGPPAPGGDEGGGGNATPGPLRPEEAEVAVPTDPEPPRPA